MDFKFGDLVVKMYVAEGTSGWFSVESGEYYILTDERRWDRGVYADGPADEVCLYSQSKMSYEWWPMDKIQKVK